MCRCQQMNGNEDSGELIRLDKVMSADIILTLDGFKGVGKTTQSRALERCFPNQIQSVRLRDTANEFNILRQDDDDRLNPMFEIVQCYRNLPRPCIADGLWSVFHTFRQYDGLSDLIHLFRACMNAYKSTEPALSIYLLCDEPKRQTRLKERNDPGDKNQRHPQELIPLFKRIEELVPYFHIIDATPSQDIVTASILDLVYKRATEAQQQQPKATI